MMVDVLQKLISLFEFLKAYQDIKSPIVRRLSDQRKVVRLAELPKHPCVRKGEDGVILIVTRPEITSGPPMPESLAEWVH
jgi:hypothetical protein